MLYLQFLDPNISCLLRSLCLHDIRCADCQQLFRSSQPQFLSGPLHAEPLRSTHIHDTQSTNISIRLKPSQHFDHGPNNFRMIAYRPSLRLTQNNKSTETVHQRNISQSHDHHQPPHLRGSSKPKKEVSTKWGLSRRLGVSLFRPEILDLFVMWTPSFSICMSTRTSRPDSRFFVFLTIGLVLRRPRLFRTTSCKFDGQKSATRCFEITLGRGRLCAAKPAAASETCQRQVSGLLKLEISNAPDLDYREPNFKFLLKGSQSNAQDSTMLQQWRRKSDVKLSVDHSQAQVHVCRQASDTP